MKTIKRAISAALSAVIGGTLLAANSASFCFTASAMTDTTFFSQYQFDSNWYSLIMQEKQKFPETFNDHQCYWNGLNEDSYTQSPCIHNGGFNQSSCIQISVPFMQYDSTNYKLFRELDLQNRPKPYSQCIGFAAKLQKDIFQTSDIVRFDMENGQYQVLDGSWQTYQPKKGDSVRLDHKHSIFITDASSAGITFAQCNANNQCEIDWDATSYNGETVTVDYLRQHATYVERPVLAGDLNLDGTIDRADAAIFADTVMRNGSRIGNTPDSALDANSDLRIDEQDYNRMLYMSGSAFQSTCYVNGSRGTCTSRWNRVSEEDGDFCVNGCIYSTRCNTVGGVSFIGVQDNNIVSVNVPEYVTNPADGQTYPVSEIGYASRYAPNTVWIKNVQNITVPKTVQKIAEKAFYNTDLKSITFAADSQLNTIDRYAFFSTDLTSVTLPPSLCTICEGAFDSCEQLTTVEVTPNSRNGCFLVEIGNSAFQGCTTLKKVRIPINPVGDIKFGTTAGIFDANSTVSLYLPNTTSARRNLILQTADANMFCNSTLLIYAGRYRLMEYNGNDLVRKLAEKRTTSLTRVYPS